MIECVPFENISSVRASLPFPYLQFNQLRESDSSLAGSFFATCSCTARIRDRSAWDKFGREIYSLDEVHRHALIVSNLANDFDMKEFYVEQSLPSGAWFRGGDFKPSERVSEMISYLNNSGIVLDFSIWRGGLRVKESVKEFLAHFIDYSFILKTYQLTMFSENLSLQLVLNHHLAIEYISPDSHLIARLEKRIKSEGIFEFPDRL